MKNFLLFIGIMALVFGIKFIYDARPIVKKYFSFGDKNDATSGLKMFGFLCVLIGSIIMYFNF
ncbi:MAG: hypothetical protein HFJ46_00150 [Clostridia bacterium]|nr:hypothetical protein [Clostridia bacterium]